MKRLFIPPLTLRGGGVYEYSDSLLELGDNETNFGEPYNLFTVTGKGASKRILVPRNMCPMSTIGDFKDGLPIKFNSLFVPRNTEQSRVISESVSLLKQGLSFLVRCPTGFGKTAITMDIIAKLGVMPLVVVTKEDVKDQWVDAFKKFLGLKDSEIGIIQGDQCSITGKKVGIAMIQSLCKLDKYPPNTFNSVGIAIFDEVHRVGADVFSDACFQLQARLRLGLSATPTRKDGKDKVLQAHIGRILVQSDATPMNPSIIVHRTSWKVPMTLQDGKIKQIPHKAGRCGHIINILVKNHDRNMSIARFVLASHKKGRHILVQSDRKEHLYELSALCQSLGIRELDIGYYVGALKKSERELAKTKRVIFATYQMTAEATDIPSLDTLVLGSPKSDVIQIVGRILRKFDGKKAPVVLDLVDSDSPVFNSYFTSRMKWYKEVAEKITYI